MTPNNMFEANEIFWWTLSFVFCVPITPELPAPASEIQAKVQKVCFDMTD